MRYSVTKVATLELLSTWFLCGNGNAFSRTVECVGIECEEWDILKAVEPLIKGVPSLDVRAGGEVRPGKGDRLDVVPGTHPDDPGEQTGETGGFGNPQETEGGFTNNCEKRSWLVFWRRSGCGGDAPTTNPPPAPPAPPANPAPPTINPPQEGPPSKKKNNNNKPATGDERFDLVNTPMPCSPIDINTRIGQFAARIQDKNAQGGPWFFYSGFKWNEVDIYKAGFDEKPTVREKKKTSYIRDAMDFEGPEELARQRDHTQHMNEVSKNLYCLVLVSADPRIAAAAFLFAGTSA